MFADTSKSMTAEMKRTIDGNLKLASHLWGQTNYATRIYLHARDYFQSTLIAIIVFSFHLSVIFVRVL